MLSRRIIVIAADRALQRRLIAGAMAAGGAVQAFADATELPPRLECDLCLFALGSAGRDAAYQTVRARLPDDAQMLPLLPAPNLAAAVELLADASVSAVLSMDGIGAPTLGATISRLLYGDLFGLDKAMPWGVRRYSIPVGDYQEKSLAIATVSDFAAAMGVRKKYRDQIEQCLDEMLMNALYDAPVDSDGKPLYAEVSVRDRVNLRGVEKVIVEYACDGERFALAVRDNYGSLRKNTVLAYLDKCLHADGAEQIDHKAGGAGLGLFLIANAATEVSFHVFRGQGTEVLCVFDLKQPYWQLRALAIHERAERRRGRDVGRRREDHPRGHFAPTLAAAILGVTTLAALAAWLLPSALHKPATLHIESDPPGAAVFLDGRHRGNTPLAVRDLEAGRSYALRSTLAGARDDDQLVVATAGESVVRLHNVRLPSTVAVDSEPPGARISVDGTDSGKQTPAELDLPAGKSATLALLLDGYRAAPLAVAVGPPGERRVYFTRLALDTSVGALDIDIEPAGAEVTVDGLPLVPPSAHRHTFVRPDANHMVRAVAEGFAEAHAQLTVHGGERRTLSLRLRPVAAQ
jgi:hypothetical protein